MSEFESQASSLSKNESTAKEKAKVIKHHKLSARMALQTKGGQKNSIFIQQKSAETSTRSGIP